VMLVIILQPLYGSVDVVVRPNIDHLPLLCRPLRLMRKWQGATVTMEMSIAG
jgi:hypothetical protein